MNKSPRLLLATLLIVTAGIGYNAAKGPDAKCVNVYVDYGVLNHGVKMNTCVDVKGKTNALDVMRLANLSSEGTSKYGDKVVCRINNFPSAVHGVGVKGHETYIETCNDMPAEFAYWAVLVKKKQLIPNPFDLSGKWNWAQTGVSEIELNPGDSLGFVFADNENVEFPK